MKKGVLVCLGFFLYTFWGWGQDTIRFVDGTLQLAKVEEVNNTLVKYRRMDNLDGPLFSVPVERVYMITYHNGSRDIFNRTNVTVAKPVEQIPVPQRSYTTAAQAIESNGPVKFMGPRLGCTAIGDGTVSTWIRDRGKVPFVSQFGWQFETRIFSSIGGVSGLVEFVPLIAGLEQGMFLPSGSLLVGIRSREGLEFAMGPNLSLSGFGMVFALGTSFHYNDVYFPINLAFVPSVSHGTTTVSYTGKKTTVTEHTGHRLSLLIGFNTRKRY